MSNTFYLPDTLADWKWQRRINPLFSEVKTASSAWLRGFNAFSAKAQDVYDRSNFDLVAGLAYPSADKERLRTGCDLFHVFFVFDEYSDVADAVEVQSQTDILMDALRNPDKPRPEGEWVGGEITRQFWQRAVKTASAQSQKHFIEAFNEYAQAIVERAADRSHSYIRSLDEYMAVRRYTVGSMPIFAILELEMDLPDEAIHHPVIEKLSVLATDMITIANDIHSYNKEQARGDDKHNIVTIIMNEHNLNLDGALSWIGNHHKTLVKEFMDAYEVLPAQWGGKVNSDLRVYADGIANCVRAVDQWDFETERYFGTKGREIQASRQVQLLPKKSRSEEVGPEGVDASLL